MKIIVLPTLLSALLLSFFALATEQGHIESNNIATLRSDTPLPEQKASQPMVKIENTDIKQVRNYPMQPPLIPHTVRNYEINLNTNKCLSCHSRQRIRESQAPMVSVTHFMDRDGNFLAEVSPRRYFCNQCHVTQSNAKPLIENTFTDMHSLINNQPAK